jgi:RNA polymerase sigma-70 factor, ECF subfamily
MDFSALDDAALLAVLAGERGSSPSKMELSGCIGALYDRYGRLVYSIALHVVGDAETAEEITQDVFVRAWEGAAGYRPELAKVSSWLVSIARHRAIDELRRRGSRREEDLTDWPEDTDPEREPDLVAPTSTEETVENSLQQHSIRQIVAGLPSDQRQVLALAYFQGLSQTQIAEHLGEPLGTVKSRIRLSMQKLRALMLERGITEQ